MVVTSKVLSIAGCCQSDARGRRTQGEQMKGRVADMKKYRFGVATMLLILFIAFCVRGTVMSKENMCHVEDSERYAAWERTFIEKTRSTLTSQGYPDSGITMTWVKKDGKRTYTVAVHHRRIERLTKEEQEQLVQMLLQEKFGNEDCGILFEL